MAIPKSLQAKLWSKSVGRLDLKADGSYVIAQLLRYGTLEELDWLTRHYPIAKITEIAQKVLPKHGKNDSAIRNFIWLWLDSRNADDRRS